MPTFSVLDAADLPERRSRPKRGLTVCLAMGLAVALSLGGLAWREGRATGAMRGEGGLATPEGFEPDETWRGRAA